MKNDVAKFLVLKMVAAPSRLCLMKTCMLCLMKTFMFFPCICALL